MRMRDQYMTNGHLVKKTESQITMTEEESPCFIKMIGHMSTLIKLVLTVIKLDQPLNSPVTILLQLLNCFHERLSLTDSNLV